MQSAGTGASITDRERRVAAEYASGLSHRDVAEKLRIAPTTVRTHLSSVYRKLGVATKIELHAALGRSAPAFSSQLKPSIAVLPFAMHGPASADDYLATGLADGVSSALSRFRGLLVISHSSCLSYRNSDLSPRVIADELGTRYAVSGRMVRSADRIRVSAELLDASTGGQAWSRTFDRELTDLFSFQDELARDIAASVAPEIEANELDKVRGPLVSDPSAWELYCRALRQFWTGMTTDHAETRKLCQGAIAKDPHFAAPHSLLSRIYFYETISARSPDPERSVRSGLDHARRALAIDGRDEVAYTVLGYNLATARRFDEAFEAIERGLSFNPNSSGLYHARATVAAFSPFGNLERAREDEWMAMRLSPNDPILWTFHVTLGVVELIDEVSGSIRAAAEAFTRGALQPNADWPADFCLSMAQIEMDRQKAARQSAIKARTKLGHLTDEDVKICFGGAVAKSDRFRTLAEQVLALAR